MAESEKRATKETTKSARKRGRWDVDALFVFVGPSNTALCFHWFVSFGCIVWVLRDFLRTAFPLYAPSLVFRGDVSLFARGPHRLVSSACSCASFVSCGSRRRIVVFRCISLQRPSKEKRKEKLPL